MGAACPSRKPAVVANTPIKVVYTSPAAPSPMKEPEAKIACPAPALPTKSWRALLQEASLNADATPFTPSAQAVAQPPGLAKPGNNQKQVDRDIPQFKRSNRNQFPKDTDVADKPSADLGNATSGGIAIQTQTYMQLLKDGGAKKKPLPSSRPKEMRPMTLKSTQSGQRQGPLSSSRTVTDMNRGSDPMTTSGLKQTWHAALKSMVRTVEDDEQAVQLQVRDDIQAEQMNIDQDLSDPVYWSDTDDVDRSNVLSKASAHSLGRRQACKVRSYVMQDLSYNLDRTVGMMLSRLHRFGEQHKKFKQESASHRRLVIGLKEVARRVKQSKVSCLIVAPDLESDTTEGGLDDRVREVLGMCYEKNIPVIFALSRTRLGHALGKTMTVSLLGVLDTTGANDLFNSAIELATKARLEWLARIPKK